MSVKKCSYFVPLNAFNKNNNFLTLFLLNTRSLRKRAQDIAKDENLMENDVGRSSDLSRK